MKKNLSRGLGIIVLLVLLTTSFRAAPAVTASPWQAKVDPWVLTTGSDSETEFLVYLTEQADLREASRLATKQEKGAYVFQRLTEVAQRTQPSVIAALKKQGVEFKPYWVANLIWVRGSLEVVQAMALRGDVAHIYANPKVKTQLPAPSLTNEFPASPTSIEWNILKVNADDVWAAGYTGQGAVVGGQDTGYDWEHPALINQYRGWDGAIADHNYNWHDAIHSGGGICGPDSTEPCDDHGHGTHTMGTMVGDDGGTNQIGMAPGARWIGCRNMDEGVGTPATYIECYEWFIAPTDLNDLNPNTDLAPDVINNSWGCPEGEGCTEPNVLLTVVNNVRAAGILTAHSAGNSGSACSTISEPAAIYDASFTVGATTIADAMASFSSRGPVTVDGSNRLKPNVSAPGSNVRSSLPGGTYGSLSGTSMAAPHVAGLVALLVSADPALAGQVDQLENIIEQSSINISSSVTPQTCGGIPSSEIPNNTFGYGRIDALAAYQSDTHSFELAKTASATDIYPGGTVTYTLAITHVNPSLDTTNVVLSDTLPTGTSFVSATQPYTFDGTTVRWDFASMGPDETQSVELVVQVLPDARNDIVNADYGVKSADVPTVLGDPVSVNLVVLNQMLSKTAPSKVAPGEILTYTLTVTNPYSSVSINNIIITDTLPANTTFITATQPYTISSGTVRWDLPSLGAADGQSVLLAVQTPDSGNVVNVSYAAVADETNQVFGTPVQTILFSDYFSVIKTAPQVVQDGSVFTYTLTVENNTSASMANHLVLTDTIPVNADFITATLPVSFDGEMVTWEKASLSPGQTWKVKLVVRAPLDYVGTIVNDDYGVKSDDIPTVVFGVPVTTQVHSLDIVKSGPPGLLEIGDLITYTLTVTNQHPVNDIHNLQLEDALPAHTAYISSDGTYSTTTGIVTWTLPALSPGESWTTNLTVEVLPGAYVMIQNKDYHVRSDETPEPLFGETVITRLRTYLFMPRIFKDSGG